MAIHGVSSAGYDTVRLTKSEPKDKPLAGQVSSRRNTPDLNNSKLSEVTLTLISTSKYDSFEPGEKPSPPKEMVQTPLPRNIVGDTIDSWNEHIERTLNTVNNMNLSYGERMSFIRQESKNWVENIKEKDPEMFAEWVRSNKDHIEAGKPHLASLPSNFTLNDYYSYVKT